MGHPPVAGSMGPIKEVSRAFKQRSHPTSIIHSVLSSPCIAESWSNWCPLLVQGEWQDRSRTGRQRLNSACETGRHFSGLAVQGLIEATSNDSFCVAGVWEKSGMAAVVMAAKLNMILSVRCLIFSPDGRTSKFDSKTTGNRRLLHSVSIATRTTASRQVNSIS